MLEEISVQPFAGAVAEHFEVAFAVVGRGPLKPEDERVFAEAMARDAAVRGGDFLVHLGGAMEHAAGEPDCGYERFASLLAMAESRAFVVPGAKEAEPAQRTLWAKRFRRPVDEWQVDGKGGWPLETPEGNGRQARHPDNFAFERGGVLFAGVDLPAGDPASEAFKAQLACAERWIEACFASSASWARAAVVFAHAFPSRHHHRFVLAFRAAAARFGRPVLFLHSDGWYTPWDPPHTSGPSHTHPRTDRHHWLKDRPWPERNIVRVQVDPVAEAAPLLVRVSLDSGEPFVFDRQYMRGPYLTCGTPESVTIQWRTGRPIDPVVRVGRAPGEWEQCYCGADVERRRPPARDRAQRVQSGAPEAPLYLHSGPPDAHQYRVVVKGLRPATRYYYAIYDGERLITGGDEEHTFVTSPEPGARVPIRIWAVGDSGKGNQVQADVHNAMLRKAEADKRPIDLFLHLGDMAYSSGTDAEFQKHFFLPYRETLRRVVLWPTMSNHEGVTSDGESDTGPYYDAFHLPVAGEAGGIPSGTLSYFGFDYGNVHFICLCSFGIDLGPEGRQARWLRENLRYVKERGKADWIIAYFHHPPYSKGSHDSDTESGLVQVRQHIMPILEEGGVDLVLSGHSHTYERTMLIDGLYGTPMSTEGCVIDDGDGDPLGDGPYRKSAGIHPHEGTVAVVCGCGGANLGRIGTAPPMKRVLVEHGSLIVDIDGDTLTAVMLSRDGEVLDRFSIVKRGKVEPRRVENPRLLPPFYNYGRVAAEAALERAPEVGEEIEAVVRVQRAPKACQAELLWDVSGTCWEVSPLADRFTLPEVGAVERRVTLRRTGPLFPVPKGKIVVFPEESSGAGEPVERPVVFLLPPWRKIALRRLAARPVIDGAIFDEEVRGLDRGGEFIEFRGTGPAACPTEFFAGLWEGWLYVAVINHQPEGVEHLYVSRPEAAEAQPWDDTCEVYVSLPGSKDVFLFLLNPKGQRLDAMNGWGERNLEWTGRWESAARVGPDRWTAEFLIDLRSLGAALAPGEELRFNVCRNNAVAREYTMWVYCNQKRAHAREFLGYATVE